MNAKVYTGLKKGFYGVFDPKNQGTETFNRALYMLISILNSPAYEYAIKAENEVVFLADCSTESINKFLDIVKRYGPMEKALQEYSIYSNEDCNKYNLALVDADNKTIEFYSTEQFVYYIGMGYDFENLVDTLFEPAISDSDATYFVKDADIECDFMAILEQCFFEYCIEDSPIYYGGFSERPYSFTDILRDYMIALQNYKDVLFEFE